MLQYRYYNMVFYYCNTGITSEKMLGRLCVSSIVPSWMIGSSEQTGTLDSLKVDNMAEEGQVDK